MERSAFLDAKLGRRFRTWDRDGSGVLEEADFAMWAERFAAAFEHAADSAAGRRMREVCASLWQNLAALADADQNGQITEDEYKNALTELVLTEPESFDDAYARPFIDAMMELADRDGDGRMDQQEYVAWSAAAFRVEEREALEAFRRLDADDDGRVTHADMVAAVRHYYLSEDPEDPEAPGNWLIGRP